VATSESSEVLSRTGQRWLATTQAVGVGWLVMLPRAAAASAYPPHGRLEFAQERRTNPMFVGRGVGLRTGWGVPCAGIWRRASLLTSGVLGRSRPEERMRVSL